jgi:transcriptional regulator with XRE-family HTH domain
MSDTRLLLEARDAARTGRAQRIREATGLSQSEVARLAGVRPSTVNRWEKRQRVPHGDVAVRWARVLRDLGDYLASPTDHLNDDRPAA